MSFPAFGAIFLGGLVGDEGCGGMVRMTLSWSTMNDSLGDALCGCFPWARGDSGGPGLDTIAEVFVFCQVAFEDTGSGRNESPDCGCGIEEEGNVAAIMSYAEGAKSTREASN